MVANKKIEPRVIYIKDHDLTATGFKTYEHAKWAVGGLPKHVEAPEYRIRIALRSRTNTFDLVVKKRTEVKETKEPTNKERQAAKDSGSPNTDGRAAP